MHSFTTKSGKEVRLEIADWEKVSELKSAIMTSLAKSDFSVMDIATAFQKKDEDISENGELIDSIFKAILFLGGSKDIDKAVISCLERSLYNHQRITQETFNSPEARADYYEIFISCIKVNLAPFFASLTSQLGAFQKMIQENLK